MICLRVSRRVRAYLVTFAAMVSLLLVSLVPRAALAREYAVGPVDIDATVAADGTLEVHERRTYDFDGSFNGIYWDVPRASFEGDDVGVSLLGVYLVKDDGLYCFEEDDSGEGGSYEVFEERDSLRLKLYWPAEDERVTFQVSYRTGPLAIRWADTAELYWQYVPADVESEVEWHDVTATIHLPVPEGEPVNPGQNVRAWAHGPIDGELRFADNDVVCYSPGVGAAEFLEARVAFPPSWLSEVNSRSEARLDTILAEEDTWAKETNAQRRRARLLVYGIPGLMVLIGLFSVVAAKLNRRFRKAKTPKARFNDTYFREVPTNDHPAVLGMLYRDGQLDGRAFSATLMRLADQGRLELDSIEHEEKGTFGRTKRTKEWRLRLRQSGRQATMRRTLAEGGKSIDKQAYRFLKDVVARDSGEVSDLRLQGSAGERYVLMSFFDDVARKSPESYERGYSWWADAVRGAYNKRGFAEELGDSVFMGVLGLGDFALFVILGIAGMLVGSPNWLLCSALILLFAAGVYVILTDDDAPRIAFTQEAADIKAKLKALERWLTDFTRLEEAIPTDVVLWNELLVMATVFGVADKVVAQLKTAAPQVLADPSFAASAWYADDRDNALGSPVSLISGSVVRGHSTSSGSLYHTVSSSSSASSHDSSSSGSGGGFSSGGGGGYHGGGRGGAF